MISLGPSFLEIIRILNDREYHTNKSEHKISLKKNKNNYKCVLTEKSDFLTKSNVFFKAF